MANADYLRVSDWPQLHDTLLIAAFAGWNDASEAATTAVRYITERLSAVPFATIDPEEFYIFSDTRPVTRFVEPGRREIIWPTNQFSYISEVAGQNRSLVTLVGIEPDLKWSKFTEIFFEVCRNCNVTEVILLGSLLAPVPHTRPVPVTGYTTNQKSLEKLESLGVNQTRYEGPTGIVGVLTTQSREESVLYGSMWGASSSYLSANPNWKVTNRLLELLNLGWNLGLPLDGVRSLTRRFEEQVSEIVSHQDDVANFVHELEEQYDNDDERDYEYEEDDDEDELEEALRYEREEGHRREETEELPSAELLIQELEKQLRLRRDDNNPPPRQ